MRPPSMSRARGAVAALGCAALVGSLAVAGVSQPAQAEVPLGLACAPYGDQTICTGAVPSFDGVPLDVDLTLPEEGTSSAGRHPLIVMLHGFGNDKHEWESTDDEADGADKLRWNSHWFARHGYYVLTYTARGFRTDAASGHQPATPPACSPSPCAHPQNTIRVKNKNVEIRDTQWLAAQVASAFPAVDPSQVAVTGGSYGGGESWLQAAEPEWTFPRTVDPSLPVLRLQVAVPKYPWTDLAYSLAPNGHGGGSSSDDVYTSSQGEREDPDGAGNPLGAGKVSYITGLYSLGTTNGVFEEGTNVAPQNMPPDPQTDPPTEPFSAWLARVAAGEPYSVGPRTDDPVVQDIRRALTRYHSAYYSPGWEAQLAAGHRTAVFSISGWTDDLFTAVESFRMFRYLKSLDPLWPVEVAAADVGHMRAQNPPAQWQRLNMAAWQFLQSHIGGAHRQRTTVWSQPTVCPAAADPGDGSTAVPAQRVTATDPAGLGRGTLVVDATTRPAVLDATSGVGDPDGPATDAIAGDVVAPNPGCRASTQESSTASPGGPFGYRALSAPLPRHETTVGIGYVEAAYTATPGATALVAARVWDVAPDGTALLVTRGVYRLDFLYGDPLAGTVKVPFYGNHWELEPGHRLRLDLQQADAPTYRPPTPGVTSTLNLTGIRLVLPTRSDGTLTLPAT